MCGRFAFYGPANLAKNAAQALHVLDPGFLPEQALAAFAANYNVAPTQHAAALALTQDGHLQAKALRWGLVPHWAKDSKMGAKAINARAETLAEKPMFRAAFKARRGLIPAAGYYEWRDEQGAKQPYYIHAKDGTTLLFAALWEVWRPENATDADEIRSFTIITGKPGKVSGAIHDRQPVILPAASLGDWLHGPPPLAAQALTQAQASDTDALVYHPVSRAVGSPRNNSPQLVQPLT